MTTLLIFYKMRTIKTSFLLLQVLAILLSSLAFSQEKNGIGKILQSEMLNWYFSNHSEPLWLSTAPGTRAEQFYRNSGWKETGRDANGEIVFEIDVLTWQKFRP